ncbi:hypothetical protein [Nocardioides sp. Root151]|uniref:hypothetical protein n=1 Tax=Nocardioides sp. Root151 TaxID=1736475 RepID=UPI0007039EC4|nr:hypothetical protein [Nocardioides sp. Root151]KQZ66331.1 hypothetical protein ASD66_22595 [Nocardioides sp. Root151]
MTDTHLETRHATPALVRGLDVAAKGALLLLLVIAFVDPNLGNMRDKGAGARAVAYPMLAFTVPVIWSVFWKERASFPWLADLMITLSCFSDIFGNRMDLYDQVVWFDDFMHFFNTGVITGAVILLTMHRSSTLLATIERALAIGVTGSVVWELAEYAAFLSKSWERHGAYTDTLGDLSLGMLGAVGAALVIHAMWKRGRLGDAAPQLELRFRNQASTV